MSGITITVVEDTLVVEALTLGGPTVAPSSPA
jgi:hypothetical protein